MIRVLDPENDNWQAAESRDGTGFNNHSSGPMRSTLLNDLTFPQSINQILEIKTSVWPILHIFNNSVVGAAQRSRKNTLTEVTGAQSSAQDHFCLFN